MKLQRPPFVYMNGRQRPWDEAVLHVGCEAVTRGLTVFEGLKGYRQPDASLGIVLVRQHYDRLTRSARLLHIPFETGFEQYEAAVCGLVETLLQPDKEMWLRTTLCVTDGHWGEDTKADLIITGYQTEATAPEPIHLGVSTWRRSVDASMPARIKTGANYQVGRLARIEGRRCGCTDMVLLNQWGRVAETTGSCIVMVRNGTVYTPPPSEGALESITVDVIESLARSLGIDFVRRPIDRTELLVADELALCGTLAEMVPVATIEGQALRSPPTLLRAIQARYFAAVRGREPHPCVQLTLSPSISGANHADRPLHEQLGRLADREMASQAAE